MGKAALLGKAKRFMVVSGIRYRLLDVLELIKQRLSGSNNEIKQKILEEIDKELMEKIAVLYTRIFKEEELDELIKFFSTPLARKVRQLRPKIKKLTMKIACKLLTRTTE